MRNRLMAAFLIVLVVAGLVLAAAVVRREVRALVREALAETLANDLPGLQALDAVNAQRQRMRIASLDTARFIDDHMATVKGFADRFQLLEHSVQSVAPALIDGLYCEFGVYKGTTIRHIAGLTTRTVHGFDSFEGLPEDWRTDTDKGTFKVTQLPIVPDHVKLHKGWFNESLPGWKKQYPGKMAFMHFDADLYSSTKTVLDMLGEQIVPGTIIQFDEYFNYPGWRQHEYRAFMEFAAARGVEFEYIGYTSTGPEGCQVALRITGTAEQPRKIAPVPGAP